MGRAANELRLHVGVFVLLLGTAYGVIHFTPAPTALFGAIVPIYFVYLGVYWVITGIRNRRGH